MNDSIASVSHFADFSCPYCWQEISLLLDVAFAEQAMVEDCPLCCHPIQLQVSMDAEGDIHVSSYSLDE